MQSALLSIAYLAPIQYFTKLLSYEKVMIEQWENYQKQSYRNRCVIATANGLLTLSIPIERSKNRKCLIRDVKIEYRTNWQKIHFKAIESAYQNAPFYLYYIDDIAPFYNRKTIYLFDLNIALQETLLKSMNIHTNIVLTEDYVFNPEIDTIDYRNSIHPKDRMIVPDKLFKTKKYPQVFDGKFGFTPNMSIIDLLFSTGPDAKEFLI